MMNGLPEEQRPIVQTAPAAVAVATAPLRRISWGAVMAGTVVSIVSFITLALLGMAIGMATYEPATEGDSARALATGGMIWWLISGIIAWFLGGWAAGRLAAAWRRIDAVLHGVATWGVTTLAVMLMMATTVGTLIGGALNVVSNTVEISGEQIADYIPGIGDRDYDARRIGTTARARTDVRDYDRDNEADAGISGSVGGRIGGVGGGVSGNVGGRAGDDGLGVGGRVSGGVGRTSDPDLRAGGDISGRVGTDADRDRDRVVVRDTERERIERERIAARDDDDDAEDARKRADRAVVTREEVVAEDAAKATAAAAGWSFLLLILGVSAAAAGGGIAARRNRWEVDAVDRVDERIP